MIDKTKGIAFIKKLVFQVIEFIAKVNGVRADAFVSKCLAIDN